MLLVPLSINPKEFKYNGTRMSTHMLQTPKFAEQAPEQDQWEKNDSCFCEENRISLVQASQRPAETI